MLLTLWAMVGGRAADAGIVVYEEGDKKIEVGGRIQLQYRRDEPEEGEAADRLFFRRLRPYVAGTVSPGWWGKIEVDFGDAAGDDEVAVKDTYLQYRGWSSLTLTIGNSKTPFSRELLTSSKRLQTVERGFVGDHNFGSPDRQLGLKLEGKRGGERLTWALALGSESHDPDARRLDFDTPANRRGDWNEGWVAAARAELHPRGLVKLEQGDFAGESLTYSVGFGAFTWWNDDDNNTFTDPETGRALDPGKADLDGAEGFEVSIALRARGLSLDGQYNRITGETVDAGFSGGVYREGSTDLDEISLVAGYMVLPERLEVVGKWEQLEADAYDEAWTVTTLGVNCFWDRHDLKLQVNYRLSDSLFGVPADDEEAVLAQMQLVF